MTNIRDLPDIMTVRYDENGNPSPASPIETHMVSEITVTYKAPYTHQGDGIKCPPTLHSHIDDSPYRQTIKFIFKDIGAYWDAIKAHTARKTNSTGDVTMENTGGELL